MGRQTGDRQRTSSRLPIQKDSMCKFKTQDPENHFCLLLTLRSNKGEAPGSPPTPPAPPGLNVLQYFIVLLSLGVK